VFAQRNQDLLVRVCAGLTTVVSALAFVYGPDIGIVTIVTVYFFFEFHAGVIQAILSDIIRKRGAFSDERQTDVALGVQSISSATAPDHQWPSFTSAPPHELAAILGRRRDCLYFDFLLAS